LFRFTSTENRSRLSVSAAVESDHRQDARVATRWIELTGRSN